MIAIIDPVPHTSLRRYARTEGDTTSLMRCLFVVVSQESSIACTMNSPSRNTCRIAYQTPPSPLCIPGVMVHTQSLPVCMHFRTYMIRVITSYSQGKRALSWMCSRQDGHVVDTAPASVHTRARWAITPT